MEETLITFETAKLAKEKGCDWILLNNGFPFPSQSLLQKWLREEKKIRIFVVDVDCADWDEPKYAYFINGDGTELDFDTYELSLEHALQEALKLI